MSPRRTGSRRTGARGAAGGRQPLTWRLLRLRHVHPTGWQRAVLSDGSLAAAALLVLADVATAWTLLVLPLTVAALVKAHDVLAALLARPLRPVGSTRPVHEPR